jgi:hypothetical protein
MDTPTLVRGLIEDGKEILEYLPQAGFEVAAAFWLKAWDGDQWHFYVVSPLAEREPFNEAFAKLFMLIRGISKPLLIDPLEVRLIGPTDPMAKDVVAIQTDAAGGESKPRRWSGGRLGNRYVDEAYLYPLSVKVS